MKHPHSLSRRQFLATVSAAAVYRPSQQTPPESGQGSTVQDVIDLLKGLASSGVPSPTVDTVKTGDPQQPTRGIVTTFLPSCAVIDKAHELGANLIVTHEPTFYTHEDETDWLEADPVYRYKRKMAEDNGIVIWRYHDYQHRIDPDPVMTAVVDRLGWSSYATAESPRIFQIPSQTVHGVADEIKRSLGPPFVRVVGDPELRCRRVGILLGSPGARGAIRFLGRHSVDLAIIGEVSSWETAAYVHDAIHSGRSMAMIVAGHAATEEPGMRWLAEALRTRLPGIPVHHVPVGHPYQSF